MASAGDTVRLASGSYGDVVITGANFGAGIIIAIVLTLPWIRRWVEK